MKNSRIKIVAGLILAVIIVVFYCSPVAAALPAGQSPIQSTNDVLTALGKIAGYLYTAFFIVAIMFIIIAAFNFLTAQGDTEKIKTARKQILWAAVAVAIVLISVAADKIIYNLIKP